MSFKTEVPRRLPDTYNTKGLCPKGQKGPEGPLEGFLFLYDGPAPVGAATGAHVMGALGLAALRAGGDGGRGEGVVAPPLHPFAP